MKLIGIITSCNFHSFTNKVEGDTVDRIAWTATGGREDPWPPDVWINGHDGREAMTVDYVSECATFNYSDYRTGPNKELVDTMSLASDVIAYLGRCFDADPNPQSRARIQQ